MLLWPHGIWDLCNATKQLTIQPLNNFFQSIVHSKSKQKASPRGGSYGRHGSTPTGAQANKYIILIVCLPIYILYCMMLIIPCIYIYTDSICIPQDYYTLLYALNKTQLEPEDYPLKNIFPNHFLLVCVRFKGAEHYQSLVDGTKYQLQCWDSVRTRSEQQIFICCLYLFYPKPKHYPLQRA